MRYPERGGVGRRQAFTLLEIPVILLTVGVAIAAAISALTHGLSGIRRNSSILIAKTAVMRQMELQRNRTFDQILALAPSTPFTIGLESLPGATGAVYVENPYLGSANLLNMTVRVTDDHGQVWREATLISR